MLKRHSVSWFVLLTVLLSYGVYFLPLPAGQRSLLVPLLLTFIPTVVCIPLVFFTERGDGLRRLFVSVHGAWKWILISAGVGALMRVAVLAAGLLEGLPIRADLGVPGTALVLLAPIPLAWFEELGWRRFALDRMLKLRSPFAAAVILGLPWAVVHLIMLLPGMISAGAPAFPQAIVLVAMSIVLAWSYVRSGGSLLAVTLLHGIQNGLVVINRGLATADAAWLMMDVYVFFAAVLVIFDRGMFFSRPADAPPAPAPL